MQTGRVPSLVLALLLFASAPSAAQTQARALARTPEIVVAYGARVRVMAPRLEPGWHSGVVGRVGSCLAVMVPQREGNRVAGYAAIPLGDVTRLRLSGRYDGRMGTSGKAVEYRPGMDTVGEAWIEVPVEPLRRRHAECSPF